MKTRYLFLLKKGIRKFSFYISNFSRYILPDSLYRQRLEQLLLSMPATELATIDERVAYYNRITEKQYDTRTWTPVRDFNFPFGQKEKFSTYFFDLHNYVRYFNRAYRFAYQFGDITQEPEMPTFVKSRPIKNGNSNAVLLKLNRIRHFVFIKDTQPFRSKKNMLVSRNIVRQPHRKKLLELYSRHPLCDIGQINRDTNSEHPEWQKEYLTIPQQLEYKFICCIEGNDVATNLKWVMASNSVAVMPRPKFETWFMEGKLIAGYHYVEIKDDYSDLIDKMEYYIQHPDEAEAIIAHAHEHVEQFLNRKRERLISLIVMQNYFRKTGQTNQSK